MSNRISIWLSIVLTLLLAYPAHAGRDQENAGNRHGGSGKHQGGPGRQNEDAGKRMVLNLVGSGSMYEQTVPDIDGDGKDEPAMCFDLGLVDADTNKAVGVGTDCFAQVKTVDNGVAMVTTTYFHLPSGTFIVRLNTSAQPLLFPTVTPRGVTVTHITGAAAKQNPIIGGTGRFARETGTARLSGLVDMANFSMKVGDPITFDCLFVIDLD
jgi:hypothetical protein